MRRFEPQKPTPVPGVGTLSLGWGEALFRLLGWRKRRWNRRDRGMHRMRARKRFGARDHVDISCGGDAAIDCYLRFIVVPCLGVLTVLATVYIIVAVLDLFLWEMLEIFKFPIL